MPSPPVLVTWIATRGDPYERTRSGGPYREDRKGRIPGPTLGLLTAPESTYAGRITDVVVLRQGGADVDRKRPAERQDAEQANPVAKAAHGAAHDNRVQARPRRRPARPRR